MPAGTALHLLWKKPSDVRRWDPACPGTPIPTPILPELRAWKGRFLSRCASGGEPEAAKMVYFAERGREPMSDCEPKPFLPTPFSRMGRVLGGGLG